jgi:GNAT superfamily N-acetyltransferase
MGLIVRPADVSLERESLIDALRRCLSQESDGPRFDWLYRQCPFGPALTWVAIDEKLGAIVGVAAAFPRRVLMGGQESPGYVLGDFGIDPRYRSLGPALQLQRACLEAVDGVTAKHGYDFPSSSMVAVYRRLRTGTTGNFVRLAKPLRADRKIREKVKLAWVSKGLGVLLNLAMDAANLRIDQSGEWTITPELEQCGSEYNKLAKSGCPSDRLCVARTAEYLNWRYRSHPTQTYRMLSARRQGELAGYVTYTTTGEDATIADLFLEEQAGLAENLVGQVISELRRKRVMTVSASFLDFDPRVRVFEKMGFYKRESVPAVFFEAGRAGPTAGTQQELDWFLMDGDRES